MSEPTTPSGLPVRVPQANISPQPTQEQAPPGGEPERPTRSPEEVQRIFAAYQSGTQRGRDVVASGGRTTEGEDE